MRSGRVLHSFSGSGLRQDEFWHLTRASKHGGSLCCTLQAVCRGAGDAHFAVIRCTGIRPIISAKRPLWRNERRKPEFNTVCR